MASRRGEKSAEAFRTISEVAAELGIPQHVLRFWETKFPQIKPLKRGGGRRYYRPDDMALLRRIRGLLYDQGYTIRGVQRLLKENGARALIEGVAAGSGPAPPAISAETTPPLPSAARDALEDLLRELEAIRALLGARGPHRRP